MRVLWEGMENPVGTDRKTPWISWEYEDENLCQRGYTLTLCGADGQELWNSGYRESARLGCRLPELKEHTSYRVRLRVFGEEGEEAEGTGGGRTGFLDEDSWTAGFITGGTLFRRTFAAGEDLERAELYYTGLGYCNAYVNGQRVSDRVLFPSYTVYEKTVEYTVCDVTERLRRGGENVVGLEVAGHWPLDETLRAKDVYSEAFYRGRLAALCQLVLFYRDGRREALGSDLSWKCSGGPVVCSSVFDGEEYDARREQTGWNDVGFDDAAWNNAVWCREKLGRLRYSYTTPIRVVRDLMPVRLEKRGGVYLADFGQNFTGWVRIRLQEPAGTRVTLRYGELLYEDGSLNVENMRAAKVTDCYICRGGGECFEPSFTYHGFRYAEISGLSGLTAEALTGREVHSDNAEISGFSCSEPLFNRIYQNMIWTMRSNFFSVPTDCCQRDERQGWMADAGVSAEFAVLGFDLQRFYRKWFGDIRDTQEESGALPYAGAPGWKRDTFIWKIGYHLCLRCLYLYTGNVRAVEENYGALRDYEQYMQTTLVNGLIPDDFYNDWLAIEFADKLMVANSFFVDFYNSMLLFAEVMGDEPYRQVLAERRQRLIEAINERFYGRCLDNPLGTGYYGTCDTLAAAPSAMAIAYGIVPEQVRDKVIRELLFQLTQSRGDIQFPTGILTTKTLIDCLSLLDRDDVTYAFMRRRQYPSLGFMIEKGATTIWERWQYLTHNEMNSHNHPALCGMGAWFFTALCGLRNWRCDAQGRVSVEFRPFVPEDMEQAHMTLRTVWGRLECGWKKENGETRCYIKAPQNIRVRESAPARQE